MRNTLKTIKRKWKCYLILFSTALVVIACGNTKETDQKFVPEIVLGSKGLHGYIAYDSPKSPEGYGAGVSFYTAAWQLIDQPLSNFQIGLPGTWIIPDNTDNETIPLCPKGTHARDNWDPRGPTYQDVFQTLEGGLGYWAGNKYRYGSPKFSLNCTSQCYDFEIASPGWSFFYDDETLSTDRLGIAQLHNRLLIPPDGLTFGGSPNGQFMGYSYMALPFTEAYGEKTPTGDQSWTCFISTKNFKGPIAYYLPETWSKVSINYPIINGRGLDARPGIIRGGATEINTVPHFESKDKDGVLYTKIPKLNFPADESGEALLVQGLTYYNKDALFNDLRNWKENGVAVSGAFKKEGAYQPEISTKQPYYRQRNKEIVGIDKIFNTKVLSATVFALQWEKSEYGKGEFPQYFKEVNDTVVVPVLSKDVPRETGLHTKKFPLAEKRPPYTSPSDGVWKTPGPASGPFTTTLNDGSVVTYYWYKFIDQPVFQQFDWSEEKKNKLQNIVEKIHKEWPIDRDFIAPPTTGELVKMDDALIVVPPEGFEIGYVPIVTRQDIASEK